MISRNFSSIKNNESKIYSFMGLKISDTGVSMAFVKLYVPLQILSAVIGFIVIKVTGVPYWNPLRNGGDTFSPYFYVFILGIPFFIVSMLLNFKIKTYTLLEYLNVYFSSKSPINQRGQKVKHMEYKIDSVVRKIL